MSIFMRERLSIEQERRCTLERANPGAPSGFELAALRIEGELDVSALRRTLMEIGRRHVALRTTFPLIAGRLVCSVAPAAAPDLPILDLAHVAEIDRDNEVRRLAREEAGSPFDLASGPLIRFRLLRFEPRLWVLLIAAHVAIFDRESVDLLLREIASHYTGEPTSAPSLSADASEPGTDSGRWERQWVQSADRDLHLSYWKERLSADALDLELPADRARSSGRSRKALTASRSLTPEFMRSLDSVSQKEGVSLQTTLLSAFAVLLSRYTSQDDFLIGIPTSGRFHPDVQGRIDRCSYLLPLRVRLAREERFGELARNIQSTLLADQEHRDISLWQIIDGLGYALDPSRHPLFQVAFELIERAGLVQAANLAISTLPVPRAGIELDLSLSIELADGGAEFTITYNAELFEAGTIERVLDNYRTLLSAISHRSSQMVSLLPLLTAVERRRILSDWNETRSEYPDSACFHEIFEAEVARAPSAVAVMFEGVALTYAELNARANQLARRLRSLGVGPDVVVGLSLDRSLAMIIGALGILKAGGAFLPLDPSYPRERLAFMVDDSRVGLLVTDTRVAAATQLKASAVLCLDAIADSLAQESSVNIDNVAKNRSLAYVIYTSGSTGRPKGVLLEHRGLCNLVAAQRAAFGLRSSDRVLQFARFSFDASVWEMAMALGAGARLCLAPSESLLPGPILFQFLLENKINVVTLPPSAVAAMPVEPLADLHTIIVAGEPCPAEIVSVWAPGRRFFNAYGPTETTVCAAMAACKAGGGRPSIGRALPNMQLYVLDRDLQPVPVGVPGELCVGGVGLARGYLNQPELTADRFIRSPFSDDPSARLYRTGDLVKWLPDGEIDFIRRIDNQVKVRGFRIELGEIDASLRRHPGIRDVVTVVREDLPGDKRIISYFIPRRQPGPSATELRSFLQERLPSFMLPTFVVAVDAFPVTPSGKIDRRALPVPERARAEKERAAGDVRTIEAILAQHTAVRKGFVFVEEDADGKAITVAYLFKRSQQTPAEDEVRAFLKGRLSEGLTPSIFVRVGLEQERFCALELVAPGAPVCVQTVVVRFDGLLDIKVLRRSLDEIMRRHSVLRTTFPLVDGRPTRSVDRAMSLDLQVLDLSLLPEIDWDDEIAREMSTDASRLFDLVSGPLIRMSLLRFGRATHVLLLSAHSAIFDEESAALLLKELVPIYESLLATRPPPFPDLPPASVDFSAWQRRWLRSLRIDAHLAFWKQRLSGELPALELPTDRARPKELSYEGGSVLQCIAPELAQSIDDLGRTEGVSLFVTLLSAFCVLLYRYTFQEDILIGTPASGRTSSEARDVIGRFSYPIVLRAALASAQTFTDLLHHMAEVVESARAHEDVPFGVLLEDLGISSEHDRHPIFQAGFELRRSTPLTVRGATISASVTPIPRDVAEVDLALSVSVAKEGLILRLVYSTDLFERTTAERMLAHLQVLLDAAVQAPQRAIGELPLLAPRELGEVTQEWTTTRVDFGPEVCIHELFEREVDASPASIAVGFEDTSLTYGELDRKANQLANHLRSLGVGPGVRVAICLERSLDMIVAVLAVLKAGAAFVPLDPTYPQDRLAFMLLDSAAPVLVIRERLAEQLDIRASITLYVDAESEKIAAQSAERLVGLADARSPAYVIYTSGSSGRPKGVLLEHGGLFNLANAQRRLFDITRADRVLQFARLSFDASVWEMVMALCSGAALWLAAQDSLLPGGELADVLRRRKITIATLPPSALAVMSVEDFPDLRVLVVAGESCPETLVERWAPDRRFFNAYGPTEASVCATVAECSVGGGRPTIGVPLANVEVYVLDRALQPVPVGVPGELYIGGVGLAREYLNRPDLTAERFIPDPFSRRPGARLYKTGDLVKWLPGGSLDFIGRIDHQVKLHGFRIELEEVEAALRRHPSVRETVVIVREDQPGDRRIVAYVCASAEAHATAQELRRSLQQTLPSYMLPSAFVLMDHFPLTPSGKIDRKALPPPSGAYEGGEGGYVAPRNATEEALALVWAELLGIERIGVFDNFFELGGHSLIAAALLTRVRVAFATDVPLRVLFDSPTVAGLASFLRDARAKGRKSVAPPIPVVDRDRPLPLSIFQQQLWLLVQANPQNPFYNETAAVTIAGVVDGEALRRSFAEVIARHEILRTTFVVEKGRAVQRVGPSTFVLSVTDLRSTHPPERAEEEARRLAEEAARQPFNLAEGPLLRALLAQISEEKSELFITIHHIIVDGVSLHKVLIPELKLVYAAIVAGRPSPLSPLAVQYGDFTVWHRKTYTAQSLDQHIVFWDRKLAGAPVLDFPTDMPRPASPRYQGARHSFQIDAAVIERLREISGRAHVTLFMTIVAVFKILLYKYTEQADIVIGTVAAGRGRPELDGLIGYFVNSIVLRTDVSGNPTFLQLLERVQQVATDAYAHQDVPFEMLVEELRIPRTRSHNPLFQVAVAFAPSSGEGDDWSIDQFALDIGISKLDLALHVNERRSGAAAVFEYDTDLFDRASIVGMVQYFTVLLGDVAQRPEAQISEFRMMRADDEPQILTQSPEVVSLGSAQCLHEMFDAQAQKTPNASAVTYDYKRLTYKDLNQRSNQLANYLRRFGVGPDVVVGLCVERSTDIVLGILGILKAGGAYAPLDPEEPPARNAAILRDISAPVILTQQKVLDRLPTGVGKLVCLDADWQAIAEEPSTMPTSGVTPSNLAYVMYTSGYTSKPKGVMIPHRNVIRMWSATKEMLASHDNFSLDERDVYTMFHSYTVDFSVWEMWGALLHGAKLIVVPYELSRSPEAFYELLCTHRVTVLSQIPSAFRYLMQVDESPEADPARLFLRLICLGGETLDVRTLRPWLERHGSAKPIVYNFYGTTGAGGFVTAGRIEAEQLNERRGSRIGRPLPGGEVYILDAYLRPAPVGVPGYIYIGGPGVARGYINSPELTAERFLRHPFGRSPDERLYKTGDRARYLQDGAIEFLGRSDQQIKLRGFRVEPREVEAALVEHPDVREASVVLREDTPGDQRLVAYYVKRSHRAPTTNDLRTFLKERLPDYMIPGMFVGVGTIAFVSNGKVDRRSLPAPDRNRPSLAPTFRLPSNAVEVIILGIWTRLLQVDQIGVKDDFFSLGGHSLLAAQMIARVRETFKLDMRQSSMLMREFMENPTIAGFAEVVDMIREATPSVRRIKGAGIEFEGESVLDSSITFDARPPENISDPRAILLTGASGFLGAFLLDELLRATKAVVYCLVRAPDVESARARIQKNMEQCEVWSQELSSRIVAVPGDLSQLLLGLSPGRFAELAKTIDVIYHNGAHVNFLYPYSALKAANVGGTREVIRFATQERLKPVHYISTLAVLASHGLFGLKHATETTPLGHADHLFMGYPESKWVAERMLMRASAAGLPVCIFRPHDVTGHSKTGVVKTEGFLCSLIRSFVELRAAPTLAIPLDFAPVDFVAQAVVHISRSASSFGKVFHLNNTDQKQLLSFVDCIREAGYTIQPLTHEEWVQRLVDYTAQNRTSPIAPFVPLFVERYSKEQLTMLEIYSSARMPEFDCSNTLEALKGTNIAAPKIDVDIMNRYILYFQKSGFIPAPPKRL